MAPKLRTSVDTAKTNTVKVWLEGKPGWPRFSFTPNQQGDADKESNHP